MSRTTAGRYFLFVALTLACLALSPAAEAKNKKGHIHDLGNGNTVGGNGALFSLTTGIENTALGYQTLFSNTTGTGNTANGVQALFSNTTGSFNAANGFQALYRNTAGFNNTAIGFQALDFSTGSFNTALGVGAGANVSTAGNVICIGANGANLSNSCYIGNIFGAGVGGGNVGVYVDSQGKLGTTLSSRRFKEEIEPMARASEALFALKPVTFHYKKEIDPQGVPQFGLVAEDVEKVNPDLVVRDAEGKVNTVRYDAVNAMLLNEFLKEHRQVEGLEVTVAQQRKDFEATIAQQQKEIQALTANLKEQAAQIQKVNAQLQLSKPSPQTALNNQPLGAGEW